MRLDVCVLGTEEQFCPFACEVLRNVHKLAPSVVPLPRVPLRVFVRQGAPHRLQDRHADEILRRDELELRVLTLYLAGYRGVDFRVRLPDVVHGSASLLFGLYEPGEDVADMQRNREPEDFVLDQTSGRCSAPAVDGCNIDA